jgi:CelD/BcsL family acetyltransferase involved in cellulose biosynthesis
MSTLLALSPLHQEGSSFAASASEGEAVQFEALPASSRIVALSAWGELESTLGSEVPLACSTLWTRAWLEHYAEAVPHEFLIARCRETVVGAALLTQGSARRNGPFKWRTRHIGTAGERHGESVCVEYNHVLAAPRFQRAFEQEVVQRLLRDKSWDALCLDGFAPGDLRQLLQDLPGAAIRLRESPYFNLSETRDGNQDVLDRLGRSTRQNTRRLLRKYGDLDVEWATDRELAEEIFAELIELHQSRWAAAGQPGAFQSERFSRFQQQLVRDGFSSLHGNESIGDSGRIVLFRVRHRGETVGCLMLLADRGRLLDYLSGFAPFEAKPSPGVVTHVLCMREALLRGFDAYDFLVGEKRHKENLSTHVNQLAWAEWTRTSFKSRVMSGLRMLKRRFRGRAAASMAEAAAAGIST